MAANCLPPFGSNNLPRPHSGGHLRRVRWYCRTSRLSANLCRATRQAVGGVIGAPKNTPAAIIEMLNKEINAVVADPNVKARLAGSGGRAIRRLRQTHN